MFSLSFKKKPLTASEPAAGTAAPGSRASIASAPAPGAPGAAGAGPGANSAMGVMAVQKGHDSTMPDREAVDAEFSKMLDELGLPAAAKAAAMKQSTEQKWAMVESKNKKEAAKKAAVAAGGASAAAIDAGKSPEAYVRDMRAQQREMSATLLETLKVELSTCGREWLTRFFAAGGLEALAAVMAHAINADKPGHVRICLEALKSTMKLSEDLERITACPDLVAAVASTLALEMPERPTPEAAKAVLDARMLALKLLTVLVATPDFEFYRVVEAAFERLRVTLGEDERYETLVALLAEPIPGVVQHGQTASGTPSAASPASVATTSSGAASSNYAAAAAAQNAFEQWTVRGMLLVFINEYLNAFDGLEERTRHRTELQLAGFLEALEATTAAAGRARAAAAAAHEPEDSPLLLALELLETSIDTFFALMTQDDAAALAAAGGDVNVTDPGEVFDEILNSCSGNGLTEQLLSVLRSLLVIPASLSHGRAMWGRVEATLRGIVLGQGGDAAAKGLRFEDIGLLLEQQNTITQLQGQLDAAAAMVAAAERGGFVSPRPGHRRPKSGKSWGGADFTAALDSGRSGGGDGAGAGAGAAGAGADGMGGGGDKDAGAAAAAATGGIGSAGASGGGAGGSDEDPSTGEEEPRPSVAYGHLPPAGVIAALDGELLAARAAAAEERQRRAALQADLSATDAAFAAGQERAMASEGKLAGVERELEEARASVERLRAELEQARSGVVGHAGEAGAGAGEAGAGAPAPVPSGSPRPPRPGGAPAGPGGPGAAGPRPGGPPRPGPAPAPGGAAGGPPRPPRPGPGAPAPAPAEAGAAAASSGPPRPPRPGAPGGPGGPAAAGAPRPGRPGPGGPAAAGPGAPAGRPGPGGAPRPGPGGPGGAAGPRPGGARPAGGGPGAGGGGQPGGGGGRPKKPRPQPGCKLKPFFWTKLLDAAVEGTVFKDMDDAKVYGALNTKLLEETFRAEAAPASGPGSALAAAQAAAAAAAKKKGPVLLLDPKRQQNAGIALARLRMRPTEIRAAVLAADTNLLPADKLQMLLSSVPTAEELGMINDYEGDKANLGSLEQFFLCVGDVPRYEQRLISMLFKLRLDTMLSESRARADKIRSAIDAIRNSTSLRAVLEWVLAIGNHLNAENASRGGAFGFKLDTLKKLSTVKDGKDGKTTLLDFLARAALDEGKVRGLGRLASDLAPVAAARLESLEALQTDVKAIERGLAQSSTQVDLCKRAAEASGGATNSEGDRFEKVMRPFVEGAAASVKRLVEDAGKLAADFKDAVNYFAEEAADTVPFFAPFIEFAAEFRRSVEKEEDKRGLNKPSPSPTGGAKGGAAAAAAAAAGGKDGKAALAAAAGAAAAAKAGGLGSGGSSGKGADGRDRAPSSTSGAKAAPAPGSPPPSTARRLGGGGGGAGGGNLVDALFGSIQSAAVEGGANSMIAEMTRRRDHRRPSMLTLAGGGGGGAGGGAGGEGGEGSAVPGHRHRRTSTAPINLSPTTAAATAAAAALGVLGGGHGGSGGGGGAAGAGAGAGAAGPVLTPKPPSHPRRHRRSRTAAAIVSAEDAAGNPAVAAALALEAAARSATSGPGRSARRSAAMLHMATMRSQHAAAVRERRAVMEAANAELAGGGTDPDFGGGGGGGATSVGSSPLSASAPASRGASPSRGGAAAPGDAGASAAVGIAEDGAGGSN